MSESAQPRRPEHRVRVASNGPAVARKVETVRLETAIRCVDMALSHAEIPQVTRAVVRATILRELEDDSRR